MKLNLLPRYIRQAKRNRNALVLMIVMVIIVLCAAGYWTMSIKKQLSAARTRDAELTQDANEVVELAASADEVYADNALVFRNVELVWYITQHNKKYPELYRKVSRRLPSYVRLASINVDPQSITYSLGAQPPWPGMGGAAKTAEPAPTPQLPTATGAGQAGPEGGLVQQAQAPPSGQSTCLVRMQAVLGNYSQYSDVMIALVRGLGAEDKFVLQVSREGFYQNRSTGLDEGYGFGGQMGPGGMPGEMPGFGEPMVAGGMGGGFGQQAGGAQPPPANWSTVTIIAQVAYNLVAPNPLAALTAASQGTAAGAAAGFGGGEAAPGMPGGAGPGVGAGAPPGPGPGRTRGGLPPAPAGRGAGLED
jgi:hypothetical protein